MRFGKKEAPVCNDLNDSRMLPEAASLKVLKGDEDPTEYHRPPYKFNCFANSLRILLAQSREPPEARTGAPRGRLAREAPRGAICRHMHHTENSSHFHNVAHKRQEVAVIKEVLADAVGMSSVTSHPGFRIAAAQWPNPEKRSRARRGPCRST